MAENPDHALEIAKALKVVKHKAKRITEIVDLSDANLKELVDSGKYGMIAKRFSAIAGIDFFAQIEKGSHFDMTKNVWFFE